MVWYSPVLVGGLGPRPLWPHPKSGVFVKDSSVMKANDTGRSFVISNEKTK